MEQKSQKKLTLADVVLLAKKAQHPPPLPARTSLAQSRWKFAVEKVIKRHVPKVVEVAAPINNELPIVKVVKESGGFLGLGAKVEKLPPIVFEKLKIGITDSEYKEKDFLNHLFRIELRYGPLKWVVYHKLYDFIRLHTRLSMEHMKGQFSHLPSFPSQGSYAISKVFGTPGSFAKLVKERRQKLETYLKEVVVQMHSGSWSIVCEFLEISAVSIRKNLGWKGKEGSMERLIKASTANFWSSDKWVSVWVMIRDSYLLYTNDILDKEAVDIVMFDKSFKFDYKVISDPLQQLLLTIHTSGRQIQLRGTDEHEMELFRKALNKATSLSPYTQKHRFVSFAPIRERSRANWYVDAERYYWDVSTAIDAAKECVFIEDWWLSPELYLRRPPAANQEWRLDRLLKRKAEQGVKIYIFLFKELEAALSIASLYAKLKLRDMHPNIVGQRHPDHIPGTGTGATYLWAHHEKIVVVDNKHAFIGGLDLCFGRYDDGRHRLCDFDPEDWVDKRCTWPGQDYSNPRVKDFIGVQNYDTYLVDKTKIPRMPWHDIALSFSGSAARDVARHFIHRWNYVKVAKAANKPEVPVLLPVGEFDHLRDESHLEGSCNIQILRSSSDWSSGIELERSIQTAYINLIAEAQHFIYIENQFFITCSTDSNAKGTFPVQNSIGKALCDRIVRAKEEGKPFKVIVVMPLMPAFEGEPEARESGSLRLVMHWQYLSISRGPDSIHAVLMQKGIRPEEYIEFYGLRTVDFMKAPKENSIPELNVARPNIVPDYVPPTKSTMTTTSAGSSAMGLNSADTQETLKSRYATELLYVHSKLMIVDDRRVICGSANINDRSMVGNHDSEIAALIEDTEEVAITMDGHSFMAAKYAHELRLHIFKEHLGLLEHPELEFDPDPLSRKFSSIWRGTASTNTLIYRDVFHCIPDDTVTTWEEYKNFVPDPLLNPDYVRGYPFNKTETEVTEQLQYIKGHLVHFPLRFLCGVDLRPPTVTKENLIPEETFL